MNDFGQFCEKIKGIHQNLIEVSCATGTIKYEHTEILDVDDIEQEDILTEAFDETSIPMLSIESNFDDYAYSYATKCLPQ